jgi:hypothetical protein
VSVITLLLASYDREAAAYVQSLGLKAVAVVSNGLQTSGHQALLVTFLHREV